MLSNHRAVTRFAVAALVFATLVAFSQQTPTQAGPEAERPVYHSLLPQTVGVAIPTSRAVRLSFDEPMDPASVEAALNIRPAVPVRYSWNDELTELSVEPASLWRTDHGYALTVGPSATTAGGQPLESARRFAFTTQTAPVVAEFQVRLAQPPLREVNAEGATDGPMTFAQVVTTTQSLPATETAQAVSGTGSITIHFTSPMDRESVEDRFSINPAVDGALSWDGHDLVFTPSAPMAPGGRYTISLVGARDRAGNELGGEPAFSFVVQPAARLVATAPEGGAEDVEPPTVEMTFSHAMDVNATNAAFGLTDSATGRLVAGTLTWNEEATQLSMTPFRALTGGRTFTVSLGDGARDLFGHPVTAEFSFTTKRAPAPAPAAATGSSSRASSAIPFVPGPASGLEGYGLNQINAARAAYGFGPLVLDPAISAVASAHAWDQLNRNYYSHYTLGSGASVRDRLSAGGVGYSSAGENQCHAMMGWGPQGTMDWCHSVFMSEPWCTGCWNHIGNILSARYTRVGIGVADNGHRVVITWDFAN